MTAPALPPPARRQATPARPLQHCGVLVAITLGLLLRLVVAFWNGFFGPSFGAEADALEFHSRAVELLHQTDAGEFALGWVYAQFLAKVYSVSGESLFIGSLLSCLAWLASALLLAGIWRQLRLSTRGMVLVFGVYALLPTAVLYTSVTLREAYQLLFVNLAAWAGLKMLRRDHSSDWLWFALAAAGMGLLHGALTAFAALLLATVLVLRGWRGMTTPARRGQRANARRARPWPRWARLGLAVAAAGAALLGASLLFPALQLELLESLASTQQGYLASDARAQYRTEFDIDGLLSVLLFLPYALIQYLFEPFPWRGLAAIDTGLVLENLLRGVLIWHVLRGLVPARSRSGPGALMLAIAYLMLELIWAPGTVNWGTAARHHIPSLGLLLACAGACRQARWRRRTTRARPLDTQALQEPQEPQSLPCPRS